ncbi:hypothetical protein Bca52824_071922 [Brassica carinata]|uniref:Uncharacterized protein n=1 Tax=Brassica carinata TaxID=52824 RepID=A0A8X7QB26_BRACI|nr:hypothetical protein Bca52824_071922 [Brassica carinata]
MMWLLPLSSIGKMRRKMNELVVLLLFSMPNRIGRNSYGKSRLCLQLWSFDSEKDGENVEVEDVTDTHVEEPAVVARRGKCKLNDPGAEARKKELLCQREAEHNSGISSGMKTFIEGLFTSAFNSFKEVVQNDIQEPL